MSEQTQESSLQDIFKPIAMELKENEMKILDELSGAQGNIVDMGGYFQPDLQKVKMAMRPSATFNDILNKL